MIRTLLNLKNWLPRRRRKSNSPYGRRDSTHSERLTVMLVPAEAWGKPLQFQVNKRTLLTVIGVGAASILLVVVGAIWLGASVLSRDGSNARSTKRASIEKDTAIVSLKTENQKLKQELRDHIRSTQERIRQVNRLMGRLSDFTGYPLDAPTSPAAGLTSGTALIRFVEEFGRGGPLSSTLSDSTELFFGHGPRAFAKIREIQLYQLDSLLVRLGQATQHFEAQERLLATTPLICPVKDGYTFTDRFGERIHPLYRRKDLHKGLDIAAPYRTPIIAPADGVVSYAGYDKSMGRTLTIDHGTGLYPRDGVPTEKRFRTRYFHCTRVLAKKGAKVKRGDVIALIGSTGTSTGNHLHYEVLVDDKPVDPEYFILNAR